MQNDALTRNKFASWNVFIANKNSAALAVRLAKAGFSSPPLMVLGHVCAMALNFYRGGCP